MRRGLYVIGECLFEIGLVVDEVHIGAESCMSVAERVGVLHILNGEWQILDRAP